MRLACSRRADSSFLVAGSLPMAEGSLRAAPKSLFRNTYRSTAPNHTTLLWVWNFPQSNLGDKTQTRHTAGPMEKEPQRERIAFRRPGPNSRASPAAPLASRRQPSKLASPASATRPSSPSASAPPAPARPSAPSQSRRAAPAASHPLFRKPFRSVAPALCGREPLRRPFFRILKSLLLYYGRVLK